MVIQGHWLNMLKGKWSGDGNALQVNGEALEGDKEALKDDGKELKQLNWSWRINWVQLKNLHHMMVSPPQMTVLLKHM